jgi:hypothetical protein
MSRIGCSCCRDPTRALFARGSDRCAEVLRLGLGLDVQLRGQAGSKAFVSIECFGGAVESLAELHALAMDLLAQRRDLDHAIDVTQRVFELSFRLAERSQIRETVQESGLQAALLLQPPFLEEVFAKIEALQEGTAIQGHRSFQGRTISPPEQRLEAHDVALDVRAVELHRVGGRAHDLRALSTQGAAELREGLAEAAAGLRLGAIGPEQRGDARPRHAEAGLSGEDPEERPALARLERNGPIRATAQLQASQGDEREVRFGQVDPCG